MWGLYLTLLLCCKQRKGMLYVFFWVIPWHLNYPEENIWHTEHSESLKSRKEGYTLLEHRRLQLHSPCFACLNIYLLQIQILLSKAEHSIAGLANIWHACPKWHAERLPWHMAFTAVPVFLISFAWPTSLCYKEYTYIYTYLIAWRVYMNCLCYQIMLWVKHFYTNRE